MKVMKVKMKIGDLVRAKYSPYFGIGIIMRERSFGGFLVYFPNAKKPRTIGLSPSSLETI